MPKKELKAKETEQVVGGSAPRWSNYCNVKFRFKEGDEVEVHRFLWSTRRVKITDRQIMTNGGDGFYVSYTGILVDNGGGKITFTENEIQGYKKKPFIN